MKSINALLPTFLFATLLTGLTACGGGGGSSSDTVDSTPPTANITFPPPVSITEGDSIIVRGTAADDSAITMVRVNGIDATTTDNFATWEVPLTLVRLTSAPFTSVITVETFDILNGDMAAATALITTVGDASLSRIPNADNPFSSPRGVVLDRANNRNRALVTDSGRDALLAVDLTTGARSIISDVFDGGPTFITPEDVVLDRANNRNRALVIDSGRDALLAVDLATGARSIISDDNTPSGGLNQFDLPVDVVLESANRALVLEEGDDSFGIPSSLIAVNLTTGARTIISDDNTPNGGLNPFSAPRGVGLDSAKNRALVIDEVLDALLAVDLATGARTIISDDNTPSGGLNQFNTPVEVVLESANRALVLDRGNSSFGGSNPPSLLAVDLTTGARSIISDSSTPNAFNAFDSPSGMVLDSANNCVLVLDSGLDAVVAVDLVDGQRVIFSR